MATVTTDWPRTHLSCGLMSGSAGCEYVVPAERRTTGNRQSASRRTFIRPSSKMIEQANRRVQSMYPDRRCWSCGLGRLAISRVPLCQLPDVLKYPSVGPRHHGFGPQLPVAGCPQMIMVHARAFEAGGYGRRRLHTTEWRFSRRTCKRGLQQTVAPDDLLRLKRIVEMESRDESYPRTAPVGVRHSAIASGIARFKVVASFATIGACTSSTSFVARTAHSTPATRVTPVHANGRTTAAVARSTPRAGVRCSWCIRKRFGLEGRRWHASTP